ncbi:MAG: phosphatase PAP2 family protein [Anaplasmataceae bacterium]|nr:phosphatase PAP2 family protein [Anaplasmataceae bacterium]
MDINRTIVLWFQDVFDGHVIFDALVVFLAEYLSYFLVIGVLYYIFMLENWRRRWIFIVLTSFIILIAMGGIAWPLQVIVGSERPFQVLDFEAFVLSGSYYSFPSLHTTFFAAIATLFFLINKRWGVWYGFLTLLVGLGRVAAGVHWPVDIFAGLIVGVLGALLGSYLGSDAFYGLRSSRGDKG